MKGICASRKEHRQANLASLAAVRGVKGGNPDLEKKVAAFRAWLEAKRAGKLAMYEWVGGQK